MSEILRTRVIRPSTRKATSTNYKVNTASVGRNDTLRVEITHEALSGRWIYSFAGSEINDRNSISFSVKELNGKIDIQWSGIVPQTNFNTKAASKNILLKGVKKGVQKNSSFDPVASHRTRVLILGTYPGEMSLEKGEYYANPTNQLWRIIETVIGNPIPSEYRAKCDYLLRHHLGLWDVCSSCQRVSSSDASIVEEVPNDLDGFISENPQLRMIVFNGQKAQKLYDKYFKRKAHFIYHTLPSTSSALTQSLFSKVDSWKVIKM